MSRTALRLGAALQADEPHVAVGHEFRVDLDPRQRFGTTQVPVAQAEPADQRLDTRIDVSAIESGNAGIGKGHHVADGIGALEGAVFCRHLPTAADNPRDFVIGGQFYAWHRDGISHGRAAPQWFGRG